MPLLSYPALAGSVDPWGAVSEILLKQGLLGLIVLVLGWLAWATIKRERARADAQDELIRTQVIPALARSNDALSRLADVLPHLAADSRH